MLNEQAVYSDLLKSFSSTLKETSKDDSGGAVCYMTNCQTRVVSFDSFKDSIIQHGWASRPKSCDALHRYSEDKWFLIEFKNGILENKSKEGFRPDTQVFFDIIRKLFESLFLLTEKLGQTIDFTRKNLVFILVYNDNEDKNGCLKIKDNLFKLGHQNDILPMSYLSEILPDKPLNISYFDKLYIKRAFVCSQNNFEQIFVKKYAN